MNGKRCEDVRENLALHIAGELDADDARAVAEHLAGCEQCSAQHAGMRRVFERLQNDHPPLPGERDWQRLASDAYIRWRDESGRTWRARGRERLKAWFTPAARPVLAAALVLLTVTAVVFLGGNGDVYNRVDFYARHFGESLPGDGPGETFESPDYTVMGFSYQSQPGSFVLGVEYARTHQACTFAFERECEDRASRLDRILNEYPHADFDDRVGYSADQARQLAMLQSLQENIRRRLDPLEAEYFLYRFGNWIQDMSLAVATGAVTLAGEKDRAGEFARLAEKFNLARGAVDALTAIEAILSRGTLEAADYQALQARLAEIYTILA
ncbi:MAG TPA: zf-HC2 domain-containing protein [Gammaproteobacteria bacterium]